jgi:hypothetical protein
MFKLVSVVLLFLALVPVAAGAAPGVAQVDPQAGRWHTWLLTSGDQLRSPPPPDAAATQLELDDLHALAVQRDNAGDARASARQRRSSGCHGRHLGRQVHLPAAAAKYG